MSQGNERSRSYFEMPLPKLPEHTAATEHGDIVKTKLWRQKQRDKQNSVAFEELLIQPGKKRNPMLHWPQRRQ